MSEHKIQNEGRNALAGQCLCFRAQVGQAWTGSDCIKLANGDMLIKNPRPFSTGLPAGFADTFGVATEVITQEMVGQSFGRAFFIEYKDAKGRLSPKQSNFLDAMRRAGARAGVARSAADAVRIALGPHT